MTGSGSKIEAETLQNGILLHHCRDFDLAQTLDCGQAFRWRKQEDGGYFGVVGQSCCHISQRGDQILLDGVTEQAFRAVWFDYFDLGRDYTALKRRFSSDPVFSRAVAYAPGIRVLRQDSWEALCSFIISQNNHLKRIQGIVQRLCEWLGQPLGNGVFAFPSPETLASASLEDLSELRAGFRARYLLDAAKRVTAGEVRVRALADMPLAEARSELMKITGVGVKVADCTLLYGCGRIECFPVDVWIGRAMKRLFPNGLPVCAKGNEGIAQQYLFHYVRTCPDAFAGN